MFLVSGALGGIDQYIGDAITMAMPFLANKDCILMMQKVILRVR